MASHEELKLSSQDDLKEWLQGKQPDWGQAIASRCALRVAPLAFTVLDPKNKGSYRQGKRFVLAVFRALFVSWSFLRHADPLPSAAQPPIELSLSKFSAATGALTVADEADETASDSHSLEEMVGNVARAAAYATGSNSWVSGFVADVVNLTASAAKGAVEILNIQAEDASTAEAVIWRAVAADAKWQLEHPRKRLIEQPLWLIEVRGDSTFKVNFPLWIRMPFDAFDKSSLARETPWKIWVAWYRALLSVQPHAMRRLISGPQTDLILTSQDEDFWERDPDTVMSDISVLLRTGNLPDNLRGKRSPPDTANDEQLSPRNVHLQFLSDGVDPSVDHLSRTEIAFILAMRMNLIWNEMNLQESKGVRSTSTQSPGFVVHIDSPWGGGKTTFMSHVARILNPWRHAGPIPAWVKEVLLHRPKNWPEEYHRPWVIVNFNAWRHQHVDPPWWVLYQAILSGGIKAIRTEPGIQDEKILPSPNRPDSGTKSFWRRCVLRCFHRSDNYPRWLWRQCLFAGYWISEYWWRFRTPALAWRFLVTLVTILVVVGAYKIEIIPAGWMPLLGIGVSTVPVAWTIFTAVHSTLITGTPDAARNFSLGSGDPFDRFRRHFAKTMHRIRRPIIVIVDDLDRCNPSYIVELIRGMQTLFLSPRVMFAILGDRNWIQRAFAQSFEEMSDINVGPEHGFGARFVEKAVQFSFVLPSISDDLRLSYVRRLLNVRDASGETMNEADAASDSSRQAYQNLRETKARVLGEEDYARREELAEEVFSGSDFDSLDEDGKEEFKRELGIELSLRAAADRSVERETRHRIEPLVPMLPANPRQIKRIVNMISFLQEVARLEGEVDPGTPKWQILARWVVLMTEWPKSWFTLSTYPALADAALAAKARKSEQRIDGLLKETADSLVQLIRGKDQVMALLRFDSGKTAWKSSDITSGEIEWLRILIPPVSGELLEVSATGSEQFSK